ncbi:MAG: hypothetical protein AAFS07_14740 [Pseudomonadota bacterium]
MRLLTCLGLVALSVPILIGVSAPAAAKTFTKPFSLELRTDDKSNGGDATQGWWREGRVNNPVPNDSTAFGVDTQPNGVSFNTRSYFSFHIPDLGDEATVLAATLTVKVGNRRGVEPNAEMTIAGVESSLGELSQRNTIDDAIFADLGVEDDNSDFYASAPITEGDVDGVTMLVFVLNEKARRDIELAMDDFFTVGASAVGGAFFGSIDPADPFIAELTIEGVRVVPLPLPAMMLLTAIGALGLAGARSARTAQA